MLSQATLAVLWLVVAWRVPALWHDRWKRAPWIALFALAVALTVNLPAAITVIDRASGIADLSTLAEHLSGIVACVAVLDWVAALAGTDRPSWPRPHHVAAAVAMACMAVLFAVMPRPETANFAATVTGGTAAAYLLVFYACLGTAMGAAAVLFWRVSRLSPPGTVRWGFWLLATGTSAGTCYAACRTGYLALRALSGISAADASAVLRYSTDLENAAIAAILAGLSVPAFGVAWQGARDLAALRGLHGLWRDLVTAVPGVTAGPWKHQVGGQVRDSRIRLIRRTAEIRDAALALRCHVPPDAVEDARQRLAALGMSGTTLDAATEACWLGLAIRASRSGPPAAWPAHVLPGGQTLAEEVRWLRQVAAASRSGHVRAVTARLSGAPTATQGGSP